MGQKRMTKIFRAVVPTFLIATTLLLSGCGASFTAETSTSDNDAGPSTSEVTPETAGRFTSPWASLFEYTYANARSEVERQALEDEKVDDQEYAFFRSKIVSCLSGIGVDAKFDDDKALSYSMPPSVTSDQITSCMQENGLAIITLRDSIDRNPTNLDENEIMVDCLKRTGSVDDSYSPDDYSRGVSSDKVVASAGFDGCNADPLNFAK